MIFGQDRNELRRMYADAFGKLQAGKPLTALESQIAAVVSEHPEYHEIFTSESMQKDWLPEGGQTNPFLHMGLHLAIREQVATNRPTGIRDIHEKLSSGAGDAHVAEHRMMEALAESLWESQSSNQAPDEQLYLERLRRLD